MVIFSSITYSVYDSFPFIIFIIIFFITTSVSLAIETRYENLAVMAVWRAKTTRKTRDSLTYCWFSVSRHSK